jgi:NADH-quinone oxidoreductase subunit E
MAFRRLHHEQPDTFAFTPANLEWAKREIAKYPEGRQASAVIPLLWRGQEQEGWVTRPMIETVAKMLDMAPIRVLEVASFYFMFHLQPVGSVAHIQVCGTTPCMLCGSEALVAVLKRRIAPKPHQLSADGRFSWEEVECLGACSNAPMVQIGKDYYEDLTPERLEQIIDTFAAGKVPVPGPQNGRFASEPISGLTSLKGERAHEANASITLALEKRDTVARITGEPLPKIEMVPLGAGTGKAAPAGRGTAPDLLKKPRSGKADDLKKIKGLGSKLEERLNDLGIFHYDQIAEWTDDQVAWVDARIEARGRIERDGWVGQARALAGKG